MSESPNRVSPLSRFATPLAEAEAAVVFTVRTALTMIDLRGGKESSFHARARTQLGVDMPRANTSAAIAGGVIFWLAPDQWLLVAEGSAAWQEPLSIAGATTTDVSHGRVAIRVSGARAREVLSKGCMLDLHPAVFAAEMCKQTAIAKIPVIIHRIGGGDGFDLYAPRSYARSLWHWLGRAAEEYGYHVAPDL